ncbi:MAG: hypothetical protein K2W82_01465 [Candidatus Obscuribacterales bacterium]|nr:hypothetical protein [Candidatus Obscuribacterales bacterium]
MNTKRNIFKMLGFLALVCFAGYGAARWTSLAFDWGYYLTKALQQSDGFFSCLTGSDASQGEGAIYASVFLFPQIGIGAFCGLFHTMFGKRKYLYLLLPALNLLLYLTFSLVAEDLFSGKDWLWFSVGLILACLSCLLTEFLSDRWGASTEMKKASWASLLAFSGLGVMFLLVFSIESMTNLELNKMGYPLELLIYACGLALVSAAGVYLLPERKAANSYYLGLLFCFPVFFSCVANVLFNTGSTFLDSIQSGANLGISALFSANIILLISILSMIFGALAGSFSRTYKVGLPTGS